MKRVDIQPQTPGHSTPGGSSGHGASIGEAQAGMAPSAPPAGMLGRSGSKHAAAADPPQRPAPPVHPADLQQAAYTVARQALGKPLTAAAKHLLWTAHETRKEALELLHHGRGNIESDVRGSEGGSLVRTEAYRRLRGSLPVVGMPDAEHRALQAALAARGGAGNCAEFAEVSAHLHARHLKPGDRISRQQVMGLDHSWLRVQSGTPVGGEPCSGPAAILDAWADGPVVEPADSRHAAGAAAPIHDAHWIIGSRGPATFKAFEEAQEGSVVEGYGRRLELAADRIKEGMNQGAFVYCMNPIPVVSQGFTDSARNAIDRSSPTTLQASAVDALLESPAPLTREQAEAHAGTVVALAKTLDVPQPDARSAFGRVARD